MLERGSNGWQKYYRNDKHAIGGKCNPWHTYVRNGEKEERKTLAWAPCKLTYLTDNPWRFSGCHRHASSTKPFEEPTSTAVFPNYNWFRASNYNFSFINIKLLSSILIERFKSLSYDKSFIFFFSSLIDLISRHRILFHIHNRKEIVF